MRCWHSVHSRVDVLLASGHAATNQTWQAPCAQDDFSHRQPRVGGVQCTHAPGASRSGANSAGDATSRCLATTRPVSKDTLRLRPHLAHLDEGLFEVCGCLGFMEVMSVWGHALASELFLSFALSFYKPENPTCPQPSQGYWRPPPQRRASVSVSVLPCMSPCATVHDPSDPPSPARHSFAASVAPPTPGASGCATCQGGLHLRDELASSSLRDSHRGPRVLPQHSIDVPRFPSRASGASSALYRRAGHFVVPRFPSWAPGAFAALYRTSPAGNRNCSILRLAIFPSQNRIQYQDAACAAKALPERAVTTVRNIF